MPLNDPCAINIMHSHHHLSLTFTISQTKALSWYALETSTLDNTYYGKVNPKNPYITDEQSDYTIFFFGAISKELPVTLSW
jgi:hypothetical protein